MYLDRSAGRHRPPARPLLLAALAALVALPIATAHARQAPQEFAGDILVESGGKSSKLHVTVDAEHARMDTSSERGDVSIVYGPDSMLIIMHPRRVYMEFTREMMERMQQMMGAMGQRVQEQAEAFDPQQVTFERTGRTDTIGEWSAFEVRAINEEDGEVTSLWLTTDAEIGLFELFGAIAGKLDSVRMPGVAGGSPLAKLRESMRYARANGLPQGAVVRVAGKDGATMTLEGVQPGPFDPSLWQAPAGYSKQQMPGM